MSHSYDIYTRESNHQRPGHLALLVDGVDAEITVDPSQFLPKCYREAAAAGATQVEIPLKADELAQAYARKALQRRVDRLKAGSLIPGGVPFDPAGKLDDSKIAPKKRQTELVAVASFMNRGVLRNLDAAQRNARFKRKAEKHDCQAEWHANRAALIARREQELAELLKSTSPKAAKQVEALRAELLALKAPILNASHGFQYAYTQYLTGAINLASDDIRIWPLMTNTTLDTVRDSVDTFSDVTADEFDGANYSSGGLALDSQAVAVDDANDRAEFDSADESVTALGAGTRSIQGIALGKFVTNTAASIPLHWIEFSSNKTPDGSDFTFAFNAEGLLQAADG